MILPRRIRILPLLAIVPLTACDGTREWLRGPAAAAAYAAPLASDTSVVTVRRVWSAAPSSGLKIDIQVGSILPDGSGLATTYWETGQPAIFDLASRTYRRFSVNDHLYGAGFAIETAVSRDGSQIAFQWYTGVWPTHLLVVDEATGESRTIMSADSASYFSPATWNPAGDSVYVLVWPPLDQDGAVKLVLVPVDGGPPRVVHSIPSGAAPWRAILSPDGQWLLYEHRLSASQPAGSDIYIINVHGGGARPLVEHPGVDKLVGWLPDTDVVLFSSERSGTTDLWSLRVSNGRPISEPRLVSPGFFRSTAVGFGDGALFYRVATGSYGVAVINADPRSGELLGAASAPLQHLNTLPRAQAWSPDGHSLAAPTPQDGPHAITVHPMDTGASRVFWLDEDLQALVVEWAADGRALFVRAARARSDPRSPHHFLRLNLVTGTTTRLFAAEEPIESVHIWRFLVTPDGRSIIQRKQRTLDDGRTEMRLVLRSLADGGERVLHRTADFIPEFSISTDGTRLAFVQQVWGKSDSLFVMQIDGSQPLKAVASWRYDAVSLLGWLPAGNALLAARLTEDGTGEEILRVGLDGVVTVVGMSPFRPVRGQPVQGAYRSRLVLSPAGNRLAHAVHNTGEELWRMDGLHELFGRNAAGAGRPNRR
jgi:Tol biopolymer transport system component